MSLYSISENDKKYEVSEISNLRVITVGSKNKILSN